MHTRATLLSFVMLFATATFAQTGKNYQLQSPDGRLTASINVGKTISWSVKDGYTDVIIPSTISLELAGGEVLGQNASVKKAETSQADELIKTPFYKKAHVSNHYNQIKLSLRGDYAVIFRAYDDGIAYRFVTERKGEITIKNEQAQFNFKNDDVAYLPFVNDYRNKDKFTTSFEAQYSKMPISKLVKDSLAFLPILVDLGNQQKAAILEADIEDYPGMYLSAGDKRSNGLSGIFARYPTLEGNGGYKNINYVVNGRADYIAKVNGTKAFPWRIVIVSNSDKELLDNDMMQKIASPSRVTDLSWIKPGKVAWDWWNNWNVSHVDFKAGVNNATYKYYIDFAAANKLEYIIIDEGWSDDADLTKINPALNLKELVEYGKQKNVNIILWSSWFAITRDLEGILSRYEQMGIKGFKIDFIDRDDQKMTKSLYEIADAAAKHHMLVDYHGMYKPSGIQHTYPNIINFEGVKGMENVKWGVKDHPGYDVSIPFIRMLSGPMDYTPGAMRNANQANWRAVNDNPISQGTRCHQLAMYTIFEAPLQMLADNPTIYQKEQECTDFIAAVPTTFDETFAIDGSVGNYVAIARRKGTTWFAGAMTSWDARDAAIDLSFLGEGKYRAIIFEDGVNADRDATDYKKTIVTVTAKDKLNIKMASGGGWSARFEKI
jgi:alpha-glucosidase